MRPAAFVLIIIVLTVALFPPLLVAGQDPEKLLAAARAGDVGQVRSLVEGGLDVDSADRYDQTALANACTSGHVEVARYLLEKGADPDRKDSFYGVSPLQKALMNGHLEIVMLLLENGSEERGMALGFALGQGMPELARAALDSGPIYESTLNRIRARAGELDESLRKLLAEARSRPDPEPPSWSAEELRKLAGNFEGFTSDTVAEVSVRDGRLLLAVDGGAATELAAVAGREFRVRDGGETRIVFTGRAGTIEGLMLMTGGGRPELLRHSVAEPVRLPESASRRPHGAADRPATDNWPAFRGANASGNGDGVDAATSWNVETGEGIRWQTEIPGLGNSSPIVWGERIFVTTAVAEGVEQKLVIGEVGGGDPSLEEPVPHHWRVLAFDKASGKKLWQTDVGSGVPLTARHTKATQANSTPVTDGRRLVVVFPTAGLAALDLGGKILWKRDLGGLNASAFYDPDIQWGFSASPILYGSTVILQVDVFDGAYLAAWDLETGEERWRVERDVASSWATPSILRGPAGDELVANGSTIHGYDPASGRELWSLGPNSELVIAAPVAGAGVVYVSAGYPPVKPIYAVRAGTRGALEVEPGEPHERLLWSHGRGGAYMPTPLLYRGLFYLVHYNGRLVVYEAASGTPIHKKRFSRGGTFTASPVAVNGKLYFPTEEGLVYVLDAEPDFEELAINDFGEPVMATPAVSQGVLFVRTPSKLVAVAKAAAEDSSQESGPVASKGSRQ